MICEVNAGVPYLESVLRIPIKEKYIQSKGPTYTKNIKTDSPESVYLNARLTKIALSAPLTLDDTNHNSTHNHEPTETTS